MNQRFRFRFLSLFFAAAVGSTETALAQDTNKPVTPADFRAVARKTVFNDTNALLAVRDYAGAEKILLSSNVEKSSTLEWYLESANKLTQAALNLRARYDYKGALTVANRALELLQEPKGVPASTKAAPKRLEDFYMLNGFIQQELLHDLAAAKANYQLAQQANGDSRRAKEALARIADAEALRERTSAKGGRK